MQSSNSRVARPRRGIAAIAVAASLAAGCTPCESARNTLINEPKQFFWERDRKESRALYLAWAEEAWASEVGRGACVSESADYAWGFREGFADYVYGGGTGEPPVVPPRPYWNALNRIGEGRAAVDQWFAGYRHGSSTARSGGYRHEAIVRSSMATQVGHALPAYNPATGEPSFQGTPMTPPPVEGELVPIPSADEPATAADGEADRAADDLPQQAPGADAIDPPIDAPPATAEPMDEPANDEALEFPAEPGPERAPARGRSAMRSPENPAVARAPRHNAFPSLLSR
ncbi:MAG: hypothetical protein ACRCT8_05810 [Lacipirellulaceae bacterium]